MTKWNNTSDSLPSRGEDDISISFFLDEQRSTKKKESEKGKYMCGDFPPNHEEVLASHD